jgi:decaprenylphospho-beta-D-erythro-pentofuranosid-2-ulose 2-reductase
MKQILIIGATSAIVREYCNLRAAENAHFTLVARNEQALLAVKDDLIARGGRVLGLQAFACGSEEDITSRATAVWNDVKGFDEVLIGYGAIGDPDTSFRDLGAASQVIQANYTSVVAWIIALLPMMEERKTCTLAVIGSVAGDRGRSNNIVYGSAKGAIALFLQGLRQHYSGTGLHFVTILPGLTDTPMTAHLSKGPLFSSASAVARAMQSGIDKRKPIVYAPGFWRIIMTIIKCIPERIFVRTSI